jgi:hypothetical protein
MYCHLCAWQGSGRFIRQRSYFQPGAACGNELMQIVENGFWGSDGFSSVTPVRTASGGCRGRFVRCVCMCACVLGPTGRLRADGQHPDIERDCVRCQPSCSAERQLPMRRDLGCGRATRADVMSYWLHVAVVPCWRPWCARVRHLAALPERASVCIMSSTHACTPSSCC